MKRERSKPPSGYVGVDAGGSRSRAVWTDDQLRPIAACPGPDANPSRLSVSEAAGRIARLVEQVRRIDPRDDPRPPRSVELLACGVAGAGRESIRSELEGSLSRLLPDVGRVHVTTDIEALLEAMQPAPDPVGQVALIAGTGSVAAGWNSRGERARAGGRGWPAGDRGSGAWIGQQALLGAQPGRRNQADRELKARDLAALVPGIVEAAQSGDEAAQALLHRAGQELARTALEVIGSLELARLRFPLALWGGLFRAGPLIRASFSDTIRAGAPGARIVEPADPPEVGALRQALRERTESP